MLKLVDVIPEVLKGQFWVQLSPLAIVHICERVGDSGRYEYETRVWTAENVEEWHWNIFPNNHRLLFHSFWLPTSAFPHKPQCGDAWLTRNEGLIFVGPGKKGTEEVEIHADWIPRPVHLRHLGLVQRCEAVGVGEKTVLEHLRESDLV